MHDRLGLIVSKNSFGTGKSYVLRSEFSFWTQFIPSDHALRERLGTHEIFTKDKIVVSVFLNYHQFSIKSYAVDVY